MSTDIDDLSDQEIVDRLLDVPSRLDAIEEVGEEAIMEDDSDRIDLVVNDFEWICEMYKAFCESFSGPEMDDEYAVDMNYTINFNEVDRYSPQATKIFAVGALGSEIEETSDYLFKKLGRNKYIEEADRIVSARTDSFKNVNARNETYR